MLGKEPPPDAQKYEAEAKSLKALAENLQYAEMKEQMLRLSALYQKLAELVEEAARHTLSAAALIETSRASRSNSSRDTAEQQ